MNIGYGDQQPRAHRVYPAATSSCARVRTAGDPAGHANARIAHILIARKKSAIGATVTAVYGLPMSFAIIKHGRAAGIFLG